MLKLTSRVRFLAVPFNDVEQTKGLSSRVPEQGLRFLTVPFNDVQRLIVSNVEQTKGLSSRVREQGLSL
ncbi:MAG: hypothetical protein ACLFTT_18705, partial [Candidatus Hydrogenedentota bacterium]